jgi:hypothetical protein
MTDCLLVFQSKLATAEAQSNAARSADTEAARRAVATTEEVGKLRAEAENQQRSAATTVANLLALAALVSAEPDQPSSVRIAARSGLA